MKLKPKHGYWETTHYPIGGCFKRADANGKQITRVIRKIEPTYKGCDLEVQFVTGVKGAINSQHTTD